jgi:hypothetical protein
MKKYQKEQEDIKHIKEFIASCGKWAPRVAICRLCCELALGVVQPDLAGLAHQGVHRLMR